MAYLLSPSSVKFEWDLVTNFSLAINEKKVKGLPLVDSDLPLEVPIAGPFILPDICQATLSFTFVSRQGRDGLERLAPGCINFLNLNISAPAHMQPDKEYFLIDVTARAHSIDWLSSDTKVRQFPAPDGREVIVLKGAITGPWTKVKVLTPEHPPIWREADWEHDGKLYHKHKGDELLTDVAWGKLDKQFPGQLLPRKFG
ncbi:MAG: hypothetical protein ACKVP7_11065 [Hyphomicrobiaceae bacterium]